MMNIFKRFLREEQGQDLIEYTLLLAFVCLASAALFVNAGSGINTIWKDASGIITNAVTAAS